MSSYPNMCVVYYLCMSNTAGRYYISREFLLEKIPSFQAGQSAREKLDGDISILPRKERVALRKSVHEGERAFQDICDKCAYFIDKTASKELSRPRVIHVDINREELIQLGHLGVYKFLTYVDVDKLKTASPVNYLYQWIQTSMARYADREETHFGDSIDTIFLHRKISAIRAKMADINGVEPTDEQVYQYILDGKAEIKSMRGKKGAQSHHEITLEDIHHQAQSAGETHFKTPVTDTFAIDSAVYREDIAQEYVDTHMSDDVQFWFDWCMFVGIVPRQWVDVVYYLGVGDFSAQATFYKERARASFIREITLLIGSKYGDIVSFATDYTASHGQGAWSAFVSNGKEISAVADDTINPLSVNDRHRKIFTMLKFDNDTVMSRITSLTKDKNTVQKT